MLFLVLKKILNNKWMMACLLLGSIIVTSMISSIPLYTNGVLQRMLVKDMEDAQASTNIYPTRFSFALNVYNNYRPGDRADAFDRVRSQMTENVPGQIGEGLIYQVEKLSMEHIELRTVESEQSNAPKQYMKMSAYSGYEDHIALKAGRMPAKEVIDGVVEVLISEKVQKEKNLVLGNQYAIRDASHQLSEDLGLKVIPVGIYTIKQENDEWWYDRAYGVNELLLVDHDLFSSYILGEQRAITGGEWIYTLDYRQMSAKNVAFYDDLVTHFKQWVMGYNGFTFSFRSADILASYVVRETMLRLTLWVLQVPIVIMLAFYIFMVSQLVVENDRNEIAVLKDRGASRAQINRTYLIQSSLLSLVSVAVGPIAAIGICKALGASNGFLELVSRTTLPIVFDTQVILYALAAGVFSVIMMMLPVIKSTYASIIEVKQQKARRWKAPWWQKIFLDFLLIGLSAYGYNMFANRQETVLVTAAQGVDLPIDPMLYIVSTLFILGVGLLFLRIYPYLIRFIYWVGKKLWSPVFYTSFIQVGRSGGREQFLMLFLILTLSIGIYSANSARTVNQNIEDRTYFNVGCDMRFESVWKYTVLAQRAVVSADMSSVSTNPTVVYHEPKINFDDKIDGVAALARVLEPDGVRVTMPVQSRDATLQAIEPYAYADVVWTRPSLMPRHITYYLKMLSQAPDAVIVSSSMKEKGVEIGSVITYSWGGQGTISGQVVAMVDYWPGVVPNSPNGEYFIIANLNYVQSKTLLEPYDVWLRKEDGATSLEVRDALLAAGFQPKNYMDAAQDMIAQKNDALLQGTNGALTMGFVVTMLVSLVGFMIYWILSLQTRRLQFGIFRAMGMSKWRVIGIIVLEQIMISVVAIFIGIVIGGVTSDLFVPLLQLVYSSAEQRNIPFEVIANRGDYLKIYAVMGFMLVSGLTVLGVIISRIKMAQAIKLGEE